MVGPTRLVRITSTGNRRKDKRVSGVSLPAIVDGIEGTIVNISLGGASFKAKKPGLEDGQEAQAVLHFSDCELELPVRVIAREEDNSLEYGLSYQGLNREAFDRIQKAVTSPHRGM